MIIKTAVFVTDYGMQLVLSYFDESLTKLDSHTRISEWVETDYPELPEDSLVSKIEYIEKMIEFERSRHFSAVDALVAKKKALLTD
jgi:hypothetical protein